MRSIHLFRILFAVLIGLSSNAFAAGLMSPKNSGLPPLEIKEHHVDVSVEDGYVITRVTQVFSNPNDITLEALYSFPVPEKAAVGEFTYWIDGQPVTGEVLEKEKAREVYEQEKAQGRETALTEKDSFKAFESAVYPVLPKQDVKIRLVYIQSAHVDHGIGHYTYPLEEGGVDEEKLSFWSYNDSVTEAFSFNMNIRSSYPIDNVRLPQHPAAAVSSSSNKEWDISLASGATSDQEGMTTSQRNQGAVHQLNQDIVVYWRHVQGLPGSIDMITHKEPGASQGTFMMTITPGDDLAPIQTGRDWVFVLDYSGSMQGKYASLTEGVRKGLQRLNPNDRFKIILFNNNSREVTNGYTLATVNNVETAIKGMESISPSGGTNLYDGLEHGIKGLDSDRASALVLVTDGVANVGITKKKDFLKLMQKHDVRLFTFVMGNSANRPLLDGMTKVSNGFAMAVSNSDDIVGKLLIATEKLKHEAFRDVEIHIDGIKTKNHTPERIGSVYRGQQIILFGHYFDEGMADLEVRAKVGGESKRYRTRFEFPKQSTLNPEIERLWAFAKIEDLQSKMDYLGHDADTEQAITDIAKEYGLVTDYTSMVVVREEVFKQLNIARTNQNRVQKENAAKQARTQAPVQDRRVDTQQPAFQNNRSYPTSSGSGAGAGSSDWLFALLLLPFIQYVFRSRKQLMPAQSQS